MAHGPLPARQSGLVLGTLPCGPAIGLGLLAQSDVSLAGAPRFAQLRELLLRLGHGPAFRGPTQRLLDLLTADREAQREVAIKPSTVLAGEVLATADAGCGSDPIGRFQSVLSISSLSCP